MATIRSDKHTENSIQEVVYSDITANMDIHPNTGDLFRITNTNAIKRAIRNLILTNKGERFYQPNLGGNITHDLFEQITVETQHQITTQIEDTLKNFEPRASLIEVVVQPQSDKNGVNILIVYSIVNVTQQQTLNIFIERIR
jgi:phage baseplate assembly protein W